MSILTQIDQKVKQKGIKDKAKVMEIFEDTGAWNLPVVDEHKKYLGFASKFKIFNSYRHVLVHFSEE